ncbi:hypothetical protein CBR_g37795 [Chara braunii]|uniref:Cupin type-1 domain-containing protein n=1 Tax=Chara braunii TaxID=69332 RepID=A0A388LNP5_CHABU|nr:hypothetical protein CBR_g37795 [Chara braunii]|eukprot:GBG83924.1 hypothetical protein CBR_g37795 [Chara braunii]
MASAMGSPPSRRGHYWVLFGALIAFVVVILAVQVEAVRVRSAAVGIWSDWAGPGSPLKRGVVSYNRFGRSLREGEEEEKWDAGGEEEKSAGKKENLEKRSEEEEEEEWGDVGCEEEKRGGKKWEPREVEEEEWGEVSCEKEKREGKEEPREEREEEEAAAKEEKRGDTEIPRREEEEAGSEERKRGEKEKPKGEEEGEGTGSESEKKGEHTKKREEEEEKIRKERKKHREEEEEEGVSEEGKEKKTKRSHHAFSVGKARVVVDTEGGSLKTWPVDVTETLPKKKWGLGLLSLHPQAMNVPLYTDADIVFFVLEGSGQIEFDMFGKHYVRDLDESDVYAVPAGHMFFFVNPSSLGVLRLFGMASTVAQNFGGKFEVFPVGGGDDPRTVLGGFDRDLMRRAFNLKHEELESLLTSQSRGWIVPLLRVSPDQLTVSNEQDKEVGKWNGEDAPSEAISGESGEDNAMARRHSVGVRSTGMWNLLRYGSVQGPALYEKVVGPFLRSVGLESAGATAGKRGECEGGAEGELNTSLSVERHQISKNRAGNSSPSFDRGQEELQLASIDVDVEKWWLSNPYNVYKSTKDFSSPHGSSTIVDRVKLSFLKHVDMGVFFVQLIKGAMLLPHWNPHGTEIAMVTAGRGMVQVTFPNGTLAMKKNVQEGDIFVVPRFHPMVQVAAQDECFHFVGFTTTSQQIHPYFLAGSSSVLHDVDARLLAAAFGISESKASRLEDAQQDAIIIPKTNTSEVSRTE